MQNLTIFFENTLDLTLLHTICCLLLTGLIWTIQLVHYPSFKFIKPSAFKKFTNFHGARVSMVVMPLMCFELFTAFLITHQNINKNLSAAFIINLIGVLLTWGSTFLLSVPIHKELNENGYNLEKIKLLVLTNWPRTTLWTARSGFLIWLLKSQLT